MREIDTGTGQLLCRVEDGVATLTMNRPEARNALSPEMGAGLRRAIEKLATSSGIGCVVLTGVGSAFCAGGDVKAMQARAVEGGNRSESDLRTLKERQRSVSGALHRLSLPVIAALSGPAAGAGCAIALACDIRIAARSAFMTTGYARVGLSGDYGISWFLARLVGHGRACELLFAPDRIEAVQALELGLVNRVVPDEALESEARALAQRIASGPREAIRFMKENIRRAHERGLEECMDREAERIIEAMRSADHREAVCAFVEKREPVFGD